MARATPWTLQVEGVGRLARKFRRFGPDGVAAARGLVQEVANEARRRARDNLAANGTNASRELSESIRLETTGDSRSGVSATVYVDAEHAPFVEFGTKAKGAASALDDFGRRARASMGYVYGVAPGAPIPPGSIDEWRGIRGIPDDLDFVIRQSIGRHGIAAQPFFWPAVTVVAESFPRKARERLATLERTWNRG